MTEPRRAQFDVTATAGPDGSILVESALSLPTVSGSVPARLGYWSKESPDAPFLTEGERTITYGETETIRSRLSEILLAMTTDRERPLLILAENSIPHALAMLAATAVGLPVAVVSPSYASPAARPWDKLLRILGQINPELILADDPDAVADLLRMSACTARVLPIREVEFLPHDNSDGMDCLAAEAAVTPDTVAKLLFTSGSTGSPKAVVNTQRMMVSNMLALTRIWPFLSVRRPVLVDWLPWNHTFGGNCCFNIALWFGGHLHIDKGRPTPALIGHSMDAMRRHRPTIYFNVPIGYELLLPLLEADRALAAEVLGGLDFLFNAGAAMPLPVRDRLEAVALDVCGRALPIFGGWGSTETAPFSTVLCFETRQPANLGVPIPGTVIKLVPYADRYELRVRGPNVTPGYWREPALTTAAFDDDGYYRIGDCGRFADPFEPAAGILFDGRTAENFKLSSGTFVNAGALRLAAIGAGETLISDVVVAGENRSHVALLIFANESACRAFLGDDICANASDAQVATHPRVTEHLRSLLTEYNRGALGSSTRIGRFAVAAEPPSAAHDEITEKGYINQRRVLARRAAFIDDLYKNGTPL